MTATPRTVIAPAAGAGAAWDRLTEDASLYLRRPFLGYAREEGYDTVLVQTGRANRLTAGVAAWRMDGHGHAYAEPSLVLRDLGVADPAQLVVGCPGAFRGDVARSAGADAADAASLAAGLQDHAADIGVGGAVALYLDDAAVDFLGPTCADAPVLMNFDTVIDAPHGLETYVDGFERRRRREMRREIRRFVDAGLTCGPESSDEAITELAPIIAASERRHGHAAAAEGVAATLRRQRRWLGADFVIFAARAQGGAMVAGAVAFLDAASVHVRICGVDRVLGGRAYEYFNVVYYAPIAFAAATGRRRVRLGMEAFEAKLLRGASLEARWGLRIAGDGCATWRAAAPGWNRRQIARAEAWRLAYPAALDPADSSAMSARAGVS